MRLLGASRLSRKLMIGALLFALPYLAVAGGLVVLVYAALTQSLQSTANTVAHHTLDTLDRVLFERYGDAQVFSGLPVVRALDRESIPKVADILVATYAPYYRLAMAVDRQGRILGVNRVDGAGRALSTASLVGRSVAGEPWFQNALRMSQPVLVEDFHVDPLVQEVLQDDRPVMSFSAPIRNPAGEVVGVWSTRLAMESLTETIALVSRSYSMSAPLPVVLVNQRGQPLMETARFGASTQQRGGRVRQQTEPVPLATVKSAGYGAYPGLGWQLRVYAPSTQSGLEIKLLRLALLPVLLLMVGIVGLRWLIKKHVLTPLHLLAEQARCLEGGVRVFSEDVGLGRMDLGGLACPSLIRAPATDTASALTERADEIGDLSRSFSTMGGQVQDQLRRFHGLFEVSQAIERTRFALPEILQLVVETGMRLTGSRYGALGVFDETGERLTQFITSGLDEATQRAIGELPVGRGLLGHLAHEEGVLRLKDLTQHPAFTGFPPHHPPMHSFIGESIRVHGRLFGRLYLTEKQGAEEFTAQDEEVVCSLVTLTGLAIENSTLLTETRQAAEALRESELRFRSVIQSATDAIILADHTGRILSFNAAAERTFGYAEREVVGRPLTLLMPERYREAHRKGLERAGTTGETRLIGTTAELVGLRKDGTEFPIECSLATWKIGGASMFSGVVRDVTERKRTAEALRESEERFALAVRGSNDGLWDGQVLPGEPWYSPRTPVWWSPRVRDMLGYDEQEFPNDLGSWMSVLHPEDKDCVFQALEAHIERKVPYDAEYRLRTKQGDYRWFCARGQALWDEGGRFVRMAGSLRDITERKRSEQDLALFQKVFAYSNEAIAIIDLQGHYLEQNEAHRRLLGYSDEELRGQTPALHLGEEPFAAIAAELANGRAYQGTVTATTKDRHILTIELSAFVVRDEKGLPVCYVGLKRDITERKATELALTVKTEQLQAISDAITTFLEHEDWQEASASILHASLHQTHSEFGFIGVLVEGPVLRILAHEGMRWDAVSNRALYEEALRTYRDVGYLEFTNFENLFGKVLTSGQVVLSNEPSTDPRSGGLPPGHPPLRHFLGVPILRGTEVVGMIGVANRPGGYAQGEQDTLAILTYAASVLYDSYRRRQREADLQDQLRQSQKMEAIGRLAGGIAHDFNNLLMVIGGYSQMLLKRLGPTDPLRGEIEEINTAGDRAAALTSQLLAFSRQQVLQPRVLDLNAVVANMESMLTRLIGEDVTLRSVLSPELGRVRADLGQMEQVIMNLAVNARDAMPRGGQLTIETANVELNETYARQILTIIPGPHVMVAMSDTGHGMDAETKARIFEPFFTTKPKDQGTGLGLSTVYGIVKQSNGSIWVYSEPGKGTTFKVYLPRVEEDAETVKPQPHRLPMPAGVETILLVEDEEGVRRLLRAALQASGYTVLEAVNGAEALQRYEQYKRPVQLLVTDVVMPGMNGRELATQMIARQPDLKVLFMSGYTADAVVRHGVSEAKVAFLQKPFAPTTLARKVREVLDGP